MSEENKETVTQILQSQITLHADPLRCYVVLVVVCCLFVVCCVLCIVCDLLLVVCFLLLVVVCCFLLFVEAAPWAVHFH